MADMFIEIESRGESFEISVTQITINANLLEQWFLTGGTRTPWGYEALKQGVRTTKFFLGYTP